VEEAEKRCPQGAKEGCSSPREQSRLGHPKMSGLRDILLPTMEIGLEDVYWYRKRCLRCNRHYMASAEHIIGRTHSQQNTTVGRIHSWQNTLSAKYNCWQNTTVGKTDGRTHSWQNTTVGRRQQSAQYTVSRTHYRQNKLLAEYTVGRTQQWHNMLSAIYHRHNELWHYTNGTT